MKIGLIGNGGHSKRIQEILSKKKIKFIIYKPKKPKYFDKQKLALLKKCKIIFIISPNKTHFKYIDQLNNNKRYIFCEKPPVNRLSELKKLKNFNSSKLYFNFNYRYSILSKILNNKKRFNLGKLLYGSIALTHGLALKKEYSKSWRANKLKSPSGVFEIVSIHFIDLINYHFKIRKTHNKRLLNFSKKGNSYDLSHINLISKDNSIIDIFSSYCAPYSKNINLIFSNGLIKQNDKKIIVRGPAKTFDKKGRFISPKILFQQNIGDNQDYNNSLNESVNFFLDQAKKGRNFKKEIFNSSLISNNIIFNKLD